MEAVIRNLRMLVAQKQWPPMTTSVITLNTKTAPLGLLATRLLAIVQPRLKVSDGLQDEYLFEEVKKKNST